MGGTDPSVEEIRRQFYTHSLSWASGRLIWPWYDRWLCCPCRVLSPANRCPSCGAGTFACLWRINENDTLIGPLTGYQCTGGWIPDDVDEQRVLLNRFRAESVRPFNLNCNLSLDSLARRWFCNIFQLIQMQTTPRVWGNIPCWKAKPTLCN